MAFALDTDPSAPDTTPQAQDPNRLSGPANASPAPTGGSGGVFGSGPPGQGAGAAPAAQAPKSNSSGSWTNLQNYLSANQDQAGAMAQNVTGGVAQQAQTAQSALANDQGAFNQQLGAATNANDTNLFNEVGTDPTSVANNASQLSEFQNDMNDQWNGPTSFAPSAQTSTDYSTAEGAVQNAGTAAGQEALLQNQYGSNGQQYNTGEANLDQLVLGGSAESQQDFNNLQSQYGNLGNDINNASTADQTAIENAQTNNQNVATEANQSLYGDGTSANPGAIANEETNLTNETSALQTQRQDAYNTVDQALTNNQYTPDQLTALGLTSGQDTYGINPTSTSYLANQVGTVNAGNAATAQDTADMQALATLSGQSALSSYIPAAAAVSTDPYSFNAPAYNTAVSNAQTEYANAMGALSFSSPAGEAPAPTFAQDLTRDTAQVNNGPKLADGRTVWGGQQGVDFSTGDLNAIMQQYGQTGFNVVKDPTSPTGWAVSDSQAQTIGNGSWPAIMGALNGPQSSNPGGNV